jgi:prevent-host-death family protein
MKQAKVSDLKNQLSRYLDYVRHGETVLVVDRNTPVAELRPLSEETSHGKLAALERKGIVRRGQNRLPRKFFKEILGGKGSGVLKALLEEREQGR